MKLSPTAVTVLEFLTWQVRLATTAQVQQMLNLTTQSRQTAANILTRLQAQQLVHNERIHVGVLDLRQPLCSWSPGDQRPYFRELAWKLLVRSRSLPRNGVTVHWATQSAATLIGGASGQLRQPLQAEHDLGTTAAYLGCASREPDAIWYGEDILRRRFRGQLGKIPDAAIVDTQEQILKAIDFGGQYSRKHLEQFHRFWQRREIPWEIW